jgi:hypothetical protein
MVNLILSSCFINYAPEALFLSESSLEGAIPSEIGELTNLSEYSMTGARSVVFIWRLILIVHFLTVAVSLDLNSCKLTGTIPKEINSLTYLGESWLLLAIIFLVSHCPHAYYNCLFFFVSQLKCICMTIC